MMASVVRHYARPALAVLVVGALALLAAAPGADASGICGRTPVVRDAIVDAIDGVSNCAGVTAFHLAQIRRLYLPAQRITRPKAGDFDGLTALTDLWVRKSHFYNDSPLDLSKNAALKDLLVHSSHFHNSPLDLSKNAALKDLDVSNSHFHNSPLDLSKNAALKDLDVRNSHFHNSPLDLSKNTALTHLILIKTGVNLPDLSKNTALTNLTVSDNQLMSLPDLSKNTALTYLNVSDNLLTSLPDLSKNTALTYLNVSDNLLMSLPDLSKNTALTRLNVSDNQLTSLPDLSKNTALTNLTVSDNQLTSLPDLSGLTALTILGVQNNPLSSNLSALTLTGSDAGVVALDKAFDSDDVVYSASVGSGVVSVTVTPVTADTGRVPSRLASAFPDPSVKVGLQGGALADVASGSASAAIGLSVGANAIDVEVTGRSGVAKTYKVTVTRQAALSSDATLSGLTVAGSTDGGAFDQTVSIGPFAAATETYTASVANGVTHVKVTPTANESNATVKVGLQGGALSDVASGSASEAIALDEGENAVTVEVTAQDGATTNEYTVTVTRQALLSARFTGAPAEHRGPDGKAIVFRVQFSEAVTVNAKALREESMSVTGGTVKKAHRVKGRDDLREIRVKPSGWGDVTVTLEGGRACGTAGAICTADGRALSNTVTATVAGPAGLSVADARAQENTDRTIDFTVSLDRAASGKVRVKYATSDGSARAGDDYTAQSGALTFQPGERTGTVRVTVLHDTHDEGEETFTLTLSKASGAAIRDGEATGTIENHDPMPRALLARFGRAAAVHVVEHVEERMAARREPGFRGRFAGRELRKGMERDVALGFLNRLRASAGVSPDDGGFGHRHGAELGARRGRADGLLNGRGLLGMVLGGGDVLTGSAVALDRETGSGGILSLWSRGAHASFHGREGVLALNGDVRTTMVGADYARGRMVAGLSLARSVGLGGYQAETAGQVRSAVTGLYPWLGYQISDLVSVWAVTGYGAGGLMLTPGESAPIESGLSMKMAAAGTRGDVLAGGAGGFALAFKADALWVGTSIDGVNGPAGRLAATEATVTRFRTGLEGSRDWALGNVLSLGPRLEVGLRHDGGDAETGAGLDVGGGLMASSPSTGLSVDVRARMLVVLQAREGFRERGMSVSLSYNPTPSTPLGFVASVSPSWGGQATSGAEALWGRETMAGMANGGFATGNRLDGEVGYGLPLGSRFVGTPRVGLTTSEYGRAYRLGYGMTLLEQASLSFELGVDALRRENPIAGGADHGLLGRATVRW